ncbi:hypothetical protein BDP27DRAFT_1416760 [Rhodocollybia butyracea]|uniref:Uncharacterized protein n=1 Tax=Rhodocollybia butyracea TaxID=206335 RepID=A0A9P5Q2X3_9AGAR|nr:hypothetical protein BDP27DRAFT_1416760 [Rhodocollybia butyracea]
MAKVEEEKEVVAERTAMILIAQVYEKRLTWWMKNSIYDSMESMSKSPFLHLRVNYAFGLAFVKIEKHMRAVSSNGEIQTGKDMYLLDPVKKNSMRGDARKANVFDVQLVLAVLVGQVGDIDRSVRIGKQCFLLLAYFPCVCCANAAARASAKGNAYMTDYSVPSHGTPVQMLDSNGKDPVQVPPAVQVHVKKYISEMVTQRGDGSVKPEHVQLTAKGEPIKSDHSGMYYYKLEGRNFCTDPPEFHGYEYGFGYGFAVTPKEDPHDLIFLVAASAKVLYGEDHWRMPLVDHMYWVFNLQHLGDHSHKEAEDKATPEFLKRFPLLRAWVMVMAQVKNRHKPPQVITDAANFLREQSRMKLSLT